MIASRLSGVAVLVLSLHTFAEQKSEFQHTPPNAANAGTAVRIDGSLAGRISYSRLVLRVRGPGEDYEDVTLELQYGDLYRAEIPASRVKPPALEYYVEGVNGSTSTPLAGTAAKPIRFQVAGAVVAEPVAPPSEPKPAPDCKKSKKGKCVEVATVEPEPKPVEPKVVEPPRAKEPAPVQRFGDQRQPDEPKPPPSARATQREALEEDLAVYMAEAPNGLVADLDEAAKRTVIPTLVLTAADLQRMGVRYVYEALDLIPGLSISRDVQGNYRVAVRGLRSDAETLFSINGVRLNNVYDAKALWTLPIDNLERIEITRGPGFGEAGLGAFLGRINLVTSQQEGVRLSGGAGLYGTYDGHLSAAHTSGGFSIFGDADVATQVGQKLTVLRDGLDASGFSQDKRTNDRRFLLNVGVGAKYASESAGTFTGSARFILEDRAALIGLFDAVGNDSRLQWNELQVALGWSKQLSVGTLSVSAWFDQQATDRLWQLAPDGFQLRAGDPETVFPEGVLENVVTGTRTIGLDAKAELAAGTNNTLSFGVTGSLATLTAYNYVANYKVGANTLLPSLARPASVSFPTEDGNGGRGPAADRTSLGLFVNDTLKPIDSLTLQGGVQVDFTMLPTVNAKGEWSGRAFVPSFGPRIGAVVTPTRAFAMRAFYSRAFRAPTPEELAGPVSASDSNQGRFVGNRALQGAYVDSIDISGEYVQRLGEGRLRLRGSGFFNHYSNAVAMIDDSGNLVPYRNRQLGVHAFGVEGDARFELTHRFTVWANASWVRAEDLGTPAAARLLTDVPQIRTGAGISVPVGPWLNVDFVARFASERRNDSRSVLELIRRYSLPGNATFAAQLRTEPLFDHLELILLGTNVFSFQYADDAIRPDRVSGGVPRDLYNVHLIARVTL